MVLTYRKLVMPGDMNPGNRLFGGKLLQWVDEAAALYVMCQLQSEQIATLKISEMLFKQAVRSGDYLEFHAENLAIGKTSLTVRLVVTRKDFERPALANVVFSCEMVFVQLDEWGEKSAPHRLFNG